MIELIIKKKILLFSIAIILLIFAFGFLGTMFIFTTPDTVYRRPAWAPQYNDYCSNPINQQNDYSTCYQQIRRYEAPSLQHLLGLDDQGRDELSQLAWGTRHSLEIGLVSSIIIVLLAVFFGAIGTYTGGILDDACQFIVNMFIVLPVIPVLIFVAYLTRANGITLNLPLFTTPTLPLILFTIPSFTFITFSLQGHILIAVIIAFTNWGWAARSIRSQVLSLKERNFINMAKVSGMGNLSISISEILQNMFSYNSLNLAISLGISIASEAGLSVLGIGEPINFPTLGTLLYWSRVLLSPTTYSFMLNVFLPPGVIITIIFVLLYVIQAEMDEIFNPRLRKG